MSTRLPGSAVLLVILVFGGAALLAQATRPGETMQLWEYHTHLTRERGVAAESRTDARRGATSTADAVLNSWGQEGWELVGVTRREVRVDDTIQAETLYAFKRPLRVVNR